MANFNSVTLVGHLTRDIDMRVIPSGASVADLGLAVNHRIKGRDGEESRDEVLFIDVTVWNKTAENCAEYLSKGSCILVHGRLKLEQWETDAGKRSKIKVIGQSVQFLDSKKKKEEGGEDYPF